MGGSRTSRTKAPCISKGIRVRTIFPHHFTVLFHNISRPVIIVELRSLPTVV